MIFEKLQHMKRQKKLEGEYTFTMGGIFLYVVKINLFERKTTYGDYFICKESFA